MGADLDDFVVASGGIEEESAFADIVTAGLFDIDVLAGVEGHDRSGGMPVIRSGDDDGVDFLIVEDFAEVFFDAGFWGSDRFDRLDRLLELGIIDVAESRDADAIHGGEGLE